MTRHDSGYVAILEVGAWRVMEDMGEPAGSPACAPGMGATLEVEVLPQAGHSERSETQGRKGDRPSRGSVERNHGPTYRNRIRGAADQGERAGNREALVAEGKRRRSGGRVTKGRAPTRGDLALRLKGRRSVGAAGRGVSRGRSSCQLTAKA